MDFLEGLSEAKWMEWRVARSQSDAWSSHVRENKEKCQAHREVSSESFFLRIYEAEKCTSSGTSRQCGALKLDKKKLEHKKKPLT